MFRAVFLNVGHGKNFRGRGDLILIKPVTSPTLSRLQLRQQFIIIITTTVYVINNSKPVQNSKRYRVKRLNTKIKEIL